MNKISIKSSMNLVLKGTRFLYTYNKLNHTYIPNPIKKPNFNAARLHNENKKQYHARIKQQKLYIRAMKNGGASYVSN